MADGDDSNDAAALAKVAIELIIIFAVGACFPEFPPSNDEAEAGPFAGLCGIDLLR